jgi:hypothetical protein
MPTLLFSPNAQSAIAKRQAYKITKYFEHCRQLNSRFVAFAWTLMGSFQGSDALAFLVNIDREASMLEPPNPFALFTRPLSSPLFPFVAVRQYAY